MALIIHAEGEIGAFLGDNFQKEGLVRVFVGKVLRSQNKLNYHFSNLVGDEKCDWRQYVFFKILSPTQKNVALASYCAKFSNTNSVTSGIGPSSKVRKIVFSAFICQYIEGNK